MGTRVLTAGSDSVNVSDSTAVSVDASNNEATEINLDAAENEGVAIGSAGDIGGDLIIQTTDAGAINAGTTIAQRGFDLGEDAIDFADRNVDDVLSFAGENNAAAFNFGRDAFDFVEGNIEQVLAFAGENNAAAFDLADKSISAVQTSGQNALRDVAAFAGESLTSFGQFAGESLAEYSELASAALDETGDFFLSAGEGFARFSADQLEQVVTAQRSETSLGTETLIKTAAITIGIIALAGVGIAYSVSRR